MERDRLTEAKIRNYFNELIIDLLTDNIPFLQLMAQHNAVSVFWITIEPCKANRLRNSQMDY